MVDRQEKGLRNFDFILLETPVKLYDKDRRKRTDHFYVIISVYPYLVCLYFFIQFADSDDAKSDA